MLPIRPFLFDLGVMIAVFTTLVLGSLIWKPRIWLHDFPDDIQQMAPPKTEQEKRLSLLFGIPFMLAVFILPLVLAWDLRVLLGPAFSFWTAWLYGYALWFGVNLWDLVVLDWIGFALTDPQNPPIPGTEGAAGWRDYRFHFIGFLKGSAMGVVFAAFFAGVITLFT